MIRRGLGLLRSLRTLARLELASPRQQPRPDLWCRGFLSRRASLYDFARYGHAAFLSDWEVEHRLARLNDPAAARLLDDKLLFHLWLERRGRGPLTAGLLGVVAEGRVVRLDGVGGAGMTEGGRRNGQTPADPHGDEIAARLPVSFVCKPLSGARGEGVRVVHSAADLPRTGVWLLERHIRQHDYAATIFPDALNTIRLVTLRDPATDTPFVAAAVHRFGVAASAPVDNFSRGGLSVWIEPQTGLLAAARSNPGLHPTDRHPTHPDTGAPIAGVRVPGWPAVQALALELAGLFPGLCHVGWDLCVTADGPRVVEGNARLPNPNLIQAHRPLLADPRVRAVLRHHGILSDRRCRRLARGG